MIINYFQTFFTYILINQVNPFLVSALAAEGLSASLAGKPVFTPMAAITPFLLIFVFWIYLPRNKLMNILIEEYMKVIVVVNKINTVLFYLGYHAPELRPIACDEASNSAMLTEKRM